MMISKFPFDKDLLDDAIYKLLCLKKYEDVWKNYEGIREISSNLKDLLQQMLQPVPEKRISFKEILEHDWCRETRLSSDEVRSVIVKQLDLEK